MPPELLKILLKRLNKVNQMSTVLQHKPCRSNYSKLLEVNPFYKMLLLHLPLIIPIIHRKFQQCIAEGDLEFLKYLSYNELTDKMSNLDQEMEREIDDLRRRYHAKRQPILDAMDQKRKRQQNF